MTQEPNSRKPYFVFTSAGVYCGKCGDPVPDKKLACKKCYGTPDANLEQKKSEKRASVRTKPMRRKFIEEAGQETFLDTVAAIDLGAAVKKCSHCGGDVPPNLLDCPFCILGTKREESYSE